MTYTPKHTTDEYLAWIDGRIASLNDEISIIKINSFAKWQASNYRASLLANRDVLARHEPIPYNDGSTFCRACNGVPCPTYLDIAQRLDEVM